MTQDATMNDKMPVLVTGGAGYIGSHAVLALREAGWPTVVIDDLSTGFREAVPADVPFYEGNVSDTVLLEQVFIEEGIGAIMHFAGSVVVPDSVSDPLGYYDNNTVKSRALIEAAVEAGIANFLFSSTAAVYGMSDEGTVTEDTPTRPINPYGWSKLMTEQMLADAGRAHGLTWAALRYFNVAGADPKGRVGQSTDGATHLIKVACEAALGKRDKVAIFGTDFPTEDGTGVRDYIHVADLAEAHVLTLEAMIADTGPGRIMNCGYGRGFSVRQVLETVAKVSGRSFEIEETDRRPGDTPQLVADASTLRETVGWQPRHDDLTTIVRHALAWERKSADEFQTA